MANGVCSRLLTLRERARYGTPAEQQQYDKALHDAALYLIHAAQELEELKRADQILKERSK